MRTRRKELRGSLCCVVHAHYGSWLMSEGETACVNGDSFPGGSFCLDGILILKLKLKDQILLLQPSITVPSFRSLLSVWLLWNWLFIRGCSEKKKSGGKDKHLKHFLSLLDLIPASLTYLLCSILPNCCFLYFVQHWWLFLTGRFV